MAVLECERVVAASLASLYLPGCPGPVLPRRRWPQIEALIRRHNPELHQVPEALADAGLWEESIALTHADRLAWGAHQVDRDRCVTVCQAGYPGRLLKLGDSAPPAFWCTSPIPDCLRLAIVGSRSVSVNSTRIASRIAREAVELGFGVVSGGARGCDSAAASGAGVEHMLEILPYGIEHHRSAHSAISLCPPSEPFSTAAAMERNALIYSCAEQTVVVHARFREGGTWLGASEALRRRRCPVLSIDDGSAAHRALVALGARAVAPSQSLREALIAPPAQLQLLTC